MNSYFGYNTPEFNSIFLSDTQYFIHKGKIMNIQKDPILFSFYFK